MIEYESYDYRLWLTIRRLFYTMGQPFLDLILYVNNPLEFEDYKVRYNNFDEEFNKHFSATSFFNSQVGAHYPLVTIGFTSIDSSECMPEYLLTVPYSFSTIDPPDCHDSEIIATNSPEWVLWYKSQLEIRFFEVLSMIDCFEMDDCPGIKINFDIMDVRFSSLSQKDEIQNGLMSANLILYNQC